MSVDSRISGFYSLSMNERRDAIAAAQQMDAEVEGRQRDIVEALSELSAVLKKAP